MGRNKAQEDNGSGDIDGAQGDQSGAKDASGGQLPGLVAAGQVIKRIQGRTPRAAKAADTGEPTERLEPPVAKRYFVTRGGRITGNGMPQTLLTGKVISDVEYDIESLKRQGIELEEQKPKSN